MAKKKKKAKARGFRLIQFVIILLIFYVAIVFNHQRKLMKYLKTKKSENLAKKQ